MCIEYYFIRKHLTTEHMVFSQDIYEFQCVSWSCCVVL